MRSTSGEGSTGADPGAARNPRPSSSRDPNLDLLRAAAISLVLVHHLGAFTTGVPGMVHRYTSLGAYGVELFFVLSGWLIGGLYWREQQRFGDVQLLRFWSRRWLRTLPPYFAVLPLAWAGVHLARGEPFDWRYLVFAQNYDTVMPFFTVSWSLCVEEHFYLLMPLSLAFVTRLRFGVGWILVAVWVAGLFMRWIDPLAVAGQPFGYSLTATHLNFAGLGLGVWFSYLRVFDERSWGAVQKAARVLVLPLLLGFLLLPLVRGPLAFDFGASYVTLVWGGALASVAGARPVPMAAARATGVLAACSYSVYLTHTMVLQASLRVLELRPGTHLWAAPAVLAAICCAGYAAYRLVERPSIVVRDRWVSRRRG